MAKEGWRNLCVRITEETHNRLMNEASASGVSATQLILEMLEARYNLEFTTIAPQHRPRKQNQESAAKK